jgi:hypothetical protein
MPGKPEGILQKSGHMPPKEGFFSIGDGNYPITLVLMQI